MTGLAGEQFDEIAATDHGFSRFADIVSLERGVAIGVTELIAGPVPLGGAATQ